MCVLRRTQLWGRGVGARQAELTTAQSLSLLVPALCTVNCDPAPTHHHRQGSIAQESCPDICRVQVGRAEAHTGHFHSANRAQSAGSMEVPKPGPPYQAAILTAHRQLEQGSWEPTGSPLLCSRPFRKQPVGERCSDSHQRNSLPTISSSGLSRDSVPLLTHRHTPGSRCPEGAWQGMDTGWHTPAGGTGCGPPGKGKQKRDSQRNGIRLPAGSRYMAGCSYGVKGIPQVCRLKWLPLVPQNVLSFENRVEDVVS